MTAAAATSQELLGIDEAYVADGNAVVEFKLIRRPEDIRSDESVFHPDMSHQIFGDEEKIYGYKNLKIRLYYSAAKLHIYLGIEYEEKLGCAVPASIEQTLTLKYGTRFITNINEFEKMIIEGESCFLPYGDLLCSYRAEYDESTNFEIYMCTSATPDFIAYHSRLQTWILWFIDAASFIDIEDPNWKFFVVYEKFISTYDNKTHYAVAGYATVYEYYAYPANIRPRISQVFVLKPFQGQGICAKLLKTIHDYYGSVKSVLDITVEDPSESFQRIRDFVDCSSCLNLATFAPDKLKEGFSDDMANEAREKFRINKRQARRVYEILRLKSTNIHDKTDFTDYRLDVKKRLNTPFQRQINAMKRCNPNDIVDLGDDEERKVKLHVLFTELVEQYNRVIERMNNYTATQTAVQ